MYVFRIILLYFSYLFSQTLRLLILLFLLRLLILFFFLLFYLLAQYPEFENLDGSEDFSLVFEEVLSGKDEKIFFCFKLFHINPAFSFLDLDSD